MAPGNNERHPSHTGTIPKTKARNNCNVPQEAVTPTRRDMASNLVSTSLDWVPVSEYNSRTNYNQSRKQTNNTSDQELNDLENSVSFESGFGRFVPVRPQPRALPLNVQNRENLSNEHQDDASSMSGHSLHPYAHQMQNGLVPHSNHANHAPAAVMIVNPTTPNAVTANMSQPFNAPNQNRKNLTNNLNPARNLDGNHSSHNNASSRTGTKTVNLMNNMYDPQSSMNNVNENNHAHRESARALGEAIVAACPDTAAVERRLGQIREYIRVTSSLVDTMRNSEDEAFIEHTKEEYDELVEMVMKLKESETKLEKVLNEEPDNVEVPAEEADVSAAAAGDAVDTEVVSEVKEDETVPKQDECTTLKKVTNLENEQLNKSLQSVIKNSNEHLISSSEQSETTPDLEEINVVPEDTVEIKEIETVPCEEITHDHHLNEVLRKNIISCVEKVAIIEEMKNKNCSNTDQDVVVRPVSVQSNGSAYSENELWQNEIKNKMELSQRRLTALKQQQKRLIKYQEEAKQQLEEINRERQSQEGLPSTSHDNFGGMQNHPMNGNYNRMYAANQIGVATTLPHSNENVASRANSEHGLNQDDRRANSEYGLNQDDRFSHRDANIASSEEAAGGAHSDVEDSLLTERGRALQAKLRELQLKKQHMENLVSEFQKLQMATHLGSNNTYSSSGEDSADDEPTRKCNNSGGNIKNEDPFKLMEIKAIKTALQKTKDLMRSVENYESDHLSGAHDDSFQMPSHSNLNDNKSEGGGSIGGWSNDGSVCRVRNSLPQRHKFTNEQHVQHHLQQQMQQQHVPQQMSHESNIASLQELAQELRMETEKIVGERARIKDMLSNKGKFLFVYIFSLILGKSFNVARSRTSSAWELAGPAERRQVQLRALLADKQRELDKLLNKEKVLCGNAEAQKMKADSCTGSIITGINQSYNSEQEEPDSRSEQILLDSQNSRDTDNFRIFPQGGLSSTTLPSRRASACCSDSDSASRTKSNQRSRARRRQTQDRLSEDNNVPQSNTSSHSMRHEPRPEPSNINMVPPIAQNVDNPINMPYPHMPPPYWNNTNKTNQDMRTNQFTQNSHSQTMERLMGTPHMSFPPSMPYNMMMPYGGMVAGCGCGCGVWGAWCWQQLLLQQRELHALRDHLSLLEERWRVETASHTLNNQVAPGNRANNYWDNFRSYSRQNLLSANNKTNADGHLGGPATLAAPQPQPLASRSHNALRRAPPPPPLSPHHKRNAARPQPPRAPDVLNLHHEPEPAPAPAHEPHANNLHAADKRKSCSKLPAKNSRPAPAPSASNLDFRDNPNLASARRDVADKATSKLFDLLRENVYSEVTTLIGVNESHPDFLIQLFKELQLISSDPLRQRVLRSIRAVLAQYGAAPDTPPAEPHEPREPPREPREPREPALGDADSAQAGGSAAPHFDDNIVRFLLLKSEEICTPELLDALATNVLNGGLDGRRPQISKKRLLEFLSKYEGMSVCGVSNDIIESLPLVLSGGGGGGAAEPALLQDVAGSLNLFSASEPALHACPYDVWAGHVHVDVEGAEPAASADKVDLLDCSEMHNGDLAEADQTCERERGPEARDRDQDALPDVVDTEEAAPAEADAEWLGLDRVPTRLHLGESSEKQKGDVNIM
ncbi:LOW QUALITY PROTEIN: uncharacterized protein LOC125228662 [Leguminivora glycinivorella]|uniref:LOW QUALITY PROTEIN: uncharacterized protein LOC125228662 n=1 Tax=Leguminivora glycinivorella TaxID=1035111 RepID=UPI00200CCD21|nr:LOW QUALITY PROTEIN: uncharacterized protein LOC125228662 [Leguminivora glycinivorella]